VVAVNAILYGLCFGIIYLSGNLTGLGDSFSIFSILVIFISTTDWGVLRINGLLMLLLIWFLWLFITFSCYFAWLDQILSNDIGFLEESGGPDGDGLDFIIYIELGSMRPVMALKWVEGDTWIANLLSVDYSCSAFINLILNLFKMKQWKSHKLISGERSKIPISNSH
jgi:hypothetical protein